MIWTDTPLGFYFYTTVGHTWNNPDVPHVSRCLTVKADMQWSVAPTISCWTNASIQPHIPNPNPNGPKGKKNMSVCNRMYLNYKNPTSADWGKF